MDRMVELDVDESINVSTYMNIARQTHWYLENHTDR